MLVNDNFFKDIFKIYSNINVSKKNKEFYKLDKIAYYYADAINSKIVAKDVYEVDIHSAFPTLCNIMFDKNCEFIQKLNSMDEKIKKNIHISTTLKDTPYLKQLNYLSKMIISSCVMYANAENDVFELKKDGIVFCGDSIKNTKLYDFYTNYLGFVIRETKYDTYIRYNRTSHYVKGDELIIKGIYKDRPKYLFDVCQKIFSGDQIDRHELNKIYSNDYYSIIKQNNLDELFYKYYACDGSKYLSSKYKYEKIKSFRTNDIIPKKYLKLFIYPLMVI